MFNKAFLSRVISPSINFLFFLCFSGIISKAFSTEEDELITTYPSSSSHNLTCELKVTNKRDRLYTESFRPNSSARPMDDSSVKGEAMSGGAVIGKDKRVEILNTNQDDWKVHGQLIMTFGKKTYIGTGTLVSPYHVLTAGHNIYDYDTKTWAKDIIFYAGKNKNRSLSGPVKYHNYRVFYNWEKSGAPESDMGIITLQEPIGNYIGWNGLFYGADELLSNLSINVSGYPGDKEPGTMWTDNSKILAVKEKQFTYTLSTFAGESGANPWVKSQKGNYYSLGTHTYGIENKYNIATRLTRGKLESLITFIQKGT